MFMHLSNQRQGPDMENEKIQTLKNMLTASFMIAVVNTDGEVIEVNEEFTKTLKYTSSELYMKDYWILNSGYHSEEFKKEVMRNLQKGEQWVGEICHRAKNGELVWLKSTKIPFVNDIKQLEGYLVVSVDITGEKMMAKWKSLAHRHELTNLPNRRMLDSSIESYVTRSQRNGTKLAVLFLDINKFKTINERYGHIVGDYFLKEVGNRLAEMPLLKDCVYHISGDEFIIIIEDVVDLEVQMQKISELFNVPFMIGNNQFRAGASIGGSIYPDHSQDIKTIIKYANDAMFLAKRDQQKSFAMYV